MLKFLSSTLVLVATLFYAQPILADQTYDTHVTVPSCKSGDIIVWVNYHRKTYIVTGSLLNPSNVALAKGQEDEIPFNAKILSGMGYEPLCKSVAISKGLMRDNNF